MKMLSSFLLVAVVFLYSCNDASKSSKDDAVQTIAQNADTNYPVPLNAPPLDLEPQNIAGPKDVLQTNGVTPNELVNFAKTLIGVPYKYASTDPTIGFDCSGFISYVFNHFNIKVPRSSIDFTHVGKDVSVNEAREGDLILFRGTVDSILTVGHMGIVTQNIDTLKFIQSTSGRAYAVTISNFSDNYKKRFVKVVRIFPD